MISLFDDNLQLAGLRGDLAVLDVITGTNGADTLTGTDGDDFIKGLKGDDLIDGGAGQDTLNGGGGDDTITGGPGIDILSGGGGDDNLFAGAGAASARATLDGGAGDDTVSGSDGNELLLGGAGDDFLFAYHGSDTLDGGAGVDTMTYRLDTVATIVDLQAGTIDTYGHHFVSNVEDVIGSRYVFDILTGNASDNALTGGNEPDTLTGNDGDDVLDGQLHGDTLSGGGGADTFLYESAQDSTVPRPDTITDLSKEDRIDLSSFGLTFTIVDEFTKNGQPQITLHYDQASGMTVMQADLDGDSRADFEIDLTGKHDHFTGFIF